MEQMQWREHRRRAGRLDALERVEHTALIGSPGEENAPIRQEDGGVREARR